MLKSFVNIFFLGVTSAGDYHWLLNLQTFYEFPYLFRSCVPVHNGHWTIHEDQPVRGITLFKWWNNLIKGLLTVVSTVNDWTYIGIAWLFQNDSESKDIVRLIVHYHYSPVFIHFIYSLIFIYHLSACRHIIWSMLIFILKYIKFNSARRNQCSSLVNLKITIIFRFLIFFSIFLLFFFLIWIVQLDTPNIIGFKFLVLIISQVKYFLI